MAKKLAGKVALVTGAARGIGAAIARRLADDGADVVISYGASRDKADALVKELQGKGVRAAALQADQAEQSQVQKLVTDAAKQFGRLDILINNAGVYAGGTLGETTFDTAALDRQRAINYDAVVTAIRAAAPLLPDGGRVISISSCLAVRVPFPGAADYSATKAALVGYTKGAARDLGPRGITVNVVNPGPTNTDMNPADGAQAADQAALLALKRYGTVEEIAAGVAFLASPEASFITGTALDIDGGFSA